VLDSTRRALIHYLPPMTRLVIFGAGMMFDHSAQSRSRRMACDHCRSPHPTRDALAVAKPTKSSRPIGLLRRPNHFHPPYRCWFDDHSLDDDIEILPPGREIDDLPRGAGAGATAAAGFWKPSNRAPTWSADLRLTPSRPDRPGPRRAQRPGIAVSIVAEILAER